MSTAGQMPTRRSSRGWAVVTGASSGLGADFARQLADRGYDVVLSARRRERLESLATHLRAKSGVEALVLACDLGVPEGASRLLAALEENHVVPSLLVNNAGFGVHGLAIEMPLPRQMEMLDLNVRALTQLSIALGAKMAERGSGAILNIGSTGSFQPSPYVAAYAATKAYVLSFSQALAWELAPHGVRVLAHCPGPTRTEFFHAASMNVSVGDALYMSSERCVTLALRALDRGARVSVPGWWNAIGAWLVPMLPQRLVTAMAARIMRPTPPHALPPAV